MSTISVYRKEYRQLLRVWNRDTLWASGHVCDAEIDLASARLGVTLPLSFRAFLSEFGAVRLNHTDLFGLGVSDLRLNLVTRNLLEWPRPPKKLLFIATTIAGHRFYLQATDSADDDTSPVLVEVHGGGHQLFALSYLHFIQELCRGLLPIYEQSTS